LDRSAATAKHAERKHLFAARNEQLDTALRLIGIAASDGLDDEALQQHDLLLLRVLCVSKGKTLLTRLAQGALPGQGVLVVLAVLRLLPLLTKAGASLDYSEDHLMVLKMQLLPALGRSMQALELKHVVGVLARLCEAIPDDDVMASAFVDEVMRRATGFASSSPVVLLPCSAACLRVVWWTAPECAVCARRRLPDQRGR